MNYLKKKKKEWKNYENFYKDDLGARIMFTRESICGYTAPQLAKKSHTSLNTIIALESGEYKNPHPDLILRIAEALDSFYMDFVEEDYEKEFLENLSWGDVDNVQKYDLINITLSFADFANKVNSFLKTGDISLLKSSDLI